MTMMTAEYEVEGFVPERGSWTPGPVGRVRVMLWTDGRAVRLERSTAGTDGGPVLTPKGWAELAAFSKQLLKHANRAWEDSGAVRVAEVPG